MSFTLKFCLLQRSFLTRLLQTTGLSLALMMASAAGLHAESVTVQGSDGANSFDNSDPDGLAGNGGDGGPATATAGSLNPITDPLNKAAATGGSGGNGGNNFAENGIPGNGGNGGAATATAATTILWLGERRCCCYRRKRWNRRARL